MNIKNTAVNKNSFLIFGFVFLFFIMERPSIINGLIRIYGMNFGFILKITYIFAILLISSIGFFAIYYAANIKSKYKWIFFILILFPTLITDVFGMIFTQPMFYGDYLGIKLAVANINDALSEYGKLLLYPLVRGIFLFLAFWLSTTFINNSGIKSIVLIACYMIIFTSICVFKKGGYTGKIPSLFSVYSFEIASLFDKKKYDYNYKGALFNPNGNKKDNIVLIVDESIRSDFINGKESSAGLNVKTNKNWNVYDFGIATSGSNCSATSNIILRKGPKPDNLDVTIYQNPLIWDYAKKAGYKTTLIDAQNNGKNHDYFDTEEREMIDNNVNTTEYKSDTDIAIALKGLLKNTGNFIMVIKRGAHFPYSKSYPDSFKPEFKWDYINKNPTRIEYARAISYQTGNFFEELLKESVTPSTLMIYTSDHGQNLKDAPGGTHCTATGEPYPGEGIVPLLVIANETSDLILSSSKKNYNNTSHFNIFSTLLYYFGYANNDYLKHYEPALIEPINKYGYFSYGSPFGYFNSKPLFKKVD